jgi:hypothetical protein
VEVPSSRAERAVRFTEIFTSFIQSPEFAGQSVNVLGVEDFEAGCLADGLFTECLNF